VKDKSTIEMDTQLH